MVIRVKKLIIINYLEFLEVAICICFFIPVNLSPF